MGLVGELNEAKTLWKNSTFFGKTVIIISTFLTMSSITSLAEVIIKWRGFIKAGIDFYKSNISQPIQDLFFWVNIKLTDNQTDIILIISIFIAPFLKAAIRYEKETKDSGLIEKVLTFLFSIAFFYWVLSTRFDKGSYSFLGVIFFSIVIASPYMFSSEVPKTERQKALIPAFLGTIGVLILAAINKGLSAPI